MTPGDGCLTAAEATRLVKGEVSGAELLRMTDHLERCASCQALMDAARVPGGGRRLASAVTSTDTPHLSEDDVQEYVDGRMSVARRAEVDEHLSWCDACAADVTDLRAFAAALPSAAADTAGPGTSAHATSRIRQRWIGAGLAAAAVLVAAVLLRPSSPSKAGDRTAQVVVSIQDGTRTVSLDGEGRLSAIDDVPPDLRDRIVQALSSGTLPLSADSGLIRPASPLMGPSAGPAPFEVVAPRATRIREVRPRFRWTPLDDARTYVVTVASVDGTAVVTSPAIATATWTPETPLVAGQRYSWQVAARRSDGTEVLTPVPPAPPALFEVIDERAAARLASLPASPLVRAIAYAEAGLLEDCERELAALSTANPQSRMLAGWLTQVREAKGSRATASTFGR